ncbi:alpha/beta fold hydrolase [Actinomadura rayongensis]|uniref:Alpha/beta fold hydrolase n=1 Tax=Actinomadura rayongensis TaxID=1429076 RepID=A0A6I4WJT4_9ACTN|nr:alpha/beta hydrolase [Actinomadura rayongensis]MXQ67956.1 alpha/beta fold hydrolase [Actinomadura rayongensis]
MRRRIARYTHEGVRDAEIAVHPFATDDGLGLTLTRFHRADCDDVVLLLHGLPASSDMFYMPEHGNLVNFLLDNGHTDVWALDFRMSNRLPYNGESHAFSLDDIALYDHPAALAELRRHVGDRRVHVIAQCLGSVSFFMSMAAGLVDGVTSVVSNSVSLATRVPSWSRLKLRFGPPVVEYGFGTSVLSAYANTARFLDRNWAISRLVSLFHHECRNRDCHMVSFMWGSGRPAMFYDHDSLAPETHERWADLFPVTGLSYYRHIRKMVEAGHAVKNRRGDAAYRALPDDYLAAAGDRLPPCLFLTGDHNRVFTDSNIVTHRVLDRRTPGRHTLKILPKYSHVDPIVGRHADRDVFPVMLEHLRAHGRERQAV